MAHSTVADELLDLSKKMRELAAKGQSKIDCSIVANALLRINEAHHAELKKIRTDIINALTIIREGE